MTAEHPHLAQWCAHATLLPLEYDETLDVECTGTSERAWPPTSTAQVAGLLREHEGQCEATCHSWRNATARCMYIYIYISWWWLQQPHRLSQQPLLRLRLLPNWLLTRRLVRSQACACWAPICTCIYIYTAYNDMQPAISSCQQAAAGCLTSQSFTTERLLQLAASQLQTGRAKLPITFGLMCSEGVCCVTDVTKERPLLTQALTSWARLHSGDAFTTVCINDGELTHTLEVAADMLSPDLLLRLEGLGFRPRGAISPSLEKQAGRCHVPCPCVFR